MIMLNAFKYLPLAAAAFLAAPVAAQDSGAVYEGAINCSALHSFISGALEDEDKAAAAVFEESATRFLYLAIVRNEKTAEKDLNRILDDLLARIESLEDDKAVETFIEAGIGRCETFRETVAEEYAAVDLSE